MITRLLAPAIYLLCLSMATADESDAVNERIPVRDHEMELHWGLDCRATWNRLQELIRYNHSCAAERGLIRDLKLCSFIYQPPGQRPAVDEPDYAAALAALTDRVCTPGT